MGTRSFGLTNLATVVALSLFSIGCSLDMSGLHHDDAGMVIVADGGLDAGFDAARLPDGQVPDAMVPDSGVMDPDTGLPDGGLPDSGLPDGGTDAGEDAGSDAGTDAGTDAGRPPPLRIRYTGATATSGLVIQIHWNEAPPSGRHDSSWYYAACNFGGGTECLVDVPELASGRTLRFFPFDATGVADRATCNFVVCPSLCTGTTCPGFSSAYMIEYLGMAVAPLSQLVNDVDTSGDGFGDRASMEGILP